MKDLVTMLDDYLKYLNPEMDYPCDGWAIVFTEPDRISDPKVKLELLERLVTRLESTWNQGKADLRNYNIDQSLVEEFCYSLDGVEEILRFFYKERYILTLDSLR